MATDPKACHDYLSQARQLRAKAEEVDAFEQVANLRRGVWFGRGWQSVKAARPRPARSIQELHITTAHRQVDQV
jgi:hypothetical protein